MTDSAAPGPGPKDPVGIEQFVSDPTAEVDDWDPATRVLALACLTYSDLDGPQRWQRAGALLGADPTLPTRNPYLAAAVGDSDSLQVQLAADPGAATAPGGPWRWPALLYLTFARVPQRDPVGTATLLLDAGADPAAGYLWQGLPTPFTALTGCFGEGECGPFRQPRHPQGSALAELLLRRGADPNDAQALYNRMFGRDDSHLRLLLRHGLGRGDGGVWRARLGTALESPAVMVARQLDWARDHGLAERIALLATYGFTQGCPPEAPSPWRRVGGPHPLDRVSTPAAVTEAVADGTDLNQRVDGRTPLHQAAWLGDVALVEALLAAGADPDLRDSAHGGTALAWAEWSGAVATAGLLRPVTGNRDADPPPDRVG